MDLINQNIRFLRKKKGYTQQQFADMLKIKRATLGAYEEGRARPNPDVQQRLTTVFGISLDQLVTQNLSKMMDGGKLAAAPGGQDVEGNHLRVLSITVDQQNRENIELVPAKASAGYLNGYADPEFIEDLPKFHLPMLPVGTYRAFEIKGDSMLPLQPGSIVIGEYVSNWTDVQDGHTYVVLSKDEGVVYKRLFSTMEKDTRLTLRSDNPSYEPYEVAYEDVLELWKAKLYISQVPSEADVNLDKMKNMLEQLQQEVMHLKTRN